MEEDSLVANGLCFDVVSVRIIEDPKKYVSYTIVVRKNGQELDEHPCLLERRYTEFLELYTKLCQEFPAIFMNCAFPKKAVLGNFSSEIILSRSYDFKLFLMLIALHENVRESASVIDFFQKKEQIETLELLSIHNYKMALAPLQMNFQLLNKLFSNRHPRVLRALCLLVACSEAAGNSQALQFAQTAVCRFEAVSDTDSLRYYVPLLQLCVKLCMIGGSPSNVEALQERLGCMKRRGIKVDGCPTLLDAVLSDYSSPDGCTPPTLRYIT